MKTSRLSLRGDQPRGTCCLEDVEKAVKTITGQVAVLPRR